MEKREAKRAVHRSASEFIELKVFVAVVETESFKGGARRLGISGPSITRHIANLENSLGVKLLQRTTRSLFVTESGSKFYERARYILGELEAAEAEAASLSAEPRGSLRVAMHAAFALQFLRPHLPGFMRTYPDITLDLMMAPERLDMLREGIDLSIQLSSDQAINATPGFTAIRLSSVEAEICASPDYIAKHGPITDPEQLRQHNCLCGRSSTFNNLWPIKYGDEVRLIRVNGTLMADYGEILLEAVRAGVGIALLVGHLVRSSLASGELVSVLPGRIAQTNVLYGIIPDREFLPKKTRIFIEFVRDIMKANARGLKLVDSRAGVPAY